MEIFSTAMQTCLILIVLRIYSWGFEMNGLMLVKPEFADMIISKEKLYEFRKSALSQNFSKISI
ncbi:hypothetical protein [Methanobrevibacter sp.]|uniref:hypothetical protein n=1 Tax=Methanobrevibacter sp. TaxID=66852 RepID=UPI002E78BEBD|nr:hypothetical protein [Methanobrevibacter sp.]